MIQHHETLGEKQDWIDSHDHQHIVLATEELQVTQFSYPWTSRLPIWLVVSLTKCPGASVKSERKTYTLHITVIKYAHTTGG